MITRVENLGKKLESKFGLYGSALLLGVAYIILACFYTIPTLRTIYLGVNFQRLSIDPFNFSRPSSVQFRILTPLIAHLLFLRGKLFIYAPLIAAVLFISSIHIYYRKKRYSFSESAGLVALMVFSTPVLFALRFPGYTDTTSYFLLFLCFVFIDSPLWYLFFALSLLNHESNLFAAPFLLMYANRNFKPSELLKSLSLFAISLLPVFLLRSYITAQTDVLYSSGYYLSLERVKGCVKVVAHALPLGIFMSFRLFWFFPLAAFAMTIKDKRYFQSTWFCLVFICSVAQMLVATDTSRLMGLAFLCILVGAEEMRKQWPAKTFKRWLWICIGLNFLVPPCYVGQFNIWPLFSVPQFIWFHILGI